MYLTPFGQSPHRIHPSEGDGGRSQRELWTRPSARQKLAHTPPPAEHTVKACLPHYHCSGVYIRFCFASDSRPRQLPSRPPNWGCWWMTSTRAGTYVLRLCPHRHNVHPFKAHGGQGLLRQPGPPSVARRWIQPPPLLLTPLLTLHCRGIIYGTVEARLDSIDDSNINPFNTPL